MNEFEFKELEAATKNFSPSNLISKGSHGSVYRGILTNGKYVAIKKQSLALQKLRDDSKLVNEARILSSLPQNSCLVNFLGISHDIDTSNHKMIVMEYMPNGTLHEVLHSPTTHTLPSWPKRLEIALQIANGIRVLHESNPSIVHRDIKSANILFDLNWKAKLADFGLSTRLTSYNDLILPAGTIGYLDPSYTTPDKLSTKIDVFSYGVALLELISGRKAIDVVKAPASIVDWAVPLIKQGKWLEICDKRIHFPPSHIENQIKHLLRVAARCVSPMEIIRPSMGQIVAKLENSRIEHTQFPLAIVIFIRDIFCNMKQRKMGTTKCTAIVNTKTTGTTDNMIRWLWKKITTLNEGADHDDEHNMCNGTLLVREILADITLK